VGTLYSWQLDFDVAEYTTLTPLLLLISCIYIISFPTVDLKISFLHTFSLKSYNTIFMWFFGNWFNARSRSQQKLSFVASLLSSFRTIISHQLPLSVIYDILSLINSTLLTADMIPLWMKAPVPRRWLSFPFIEEYV